MRRALLIGIDRYEDAGLVLSAPKNDVARMEVVLEAVGYQTENDDRLVASQDASLSTNTLRRKLKAFFNQAQADDNLLVYFSGHGIEQDGHRLLIPQDYYLDDPRPPGELVSDGNLQGWARSSPAASVLILIDACREGLRLQLVEDKGMPAQDLPEASADTPTLAMVYSCGQGQTSRSNPAGDGLSHFTQALCAVLTAEEGPAILDEILKATQAKLDAILAEAHLPGQTVTLDEREITGRAGPPRRLLVKENPAALLRQRWERSAWCRQAKDSVFWQRIEAASRGLASQTLALVLRAEDLCKQAEANLPAQRWRDGQAPGRVAARLAHLLDHRADGLTAAEAALAVAVPYVYEALLAAGENWLSQDGNPLNPLAQPDTAQTGRAWRALRNVCLSEEAFARRGGLLRQRGKHDAADDLGAWQMLRFLHTSGELWESANGWASTELAELCKLAPLAPLAEVAGDSRVARLLDGRRLARLARLAFAEFDDIRQEGGGEQDPELDEALRLGEGGDGWCVNEVALAHLLALAFGLAADPRRLDPVLAEHLGMADAISAEKLRKALQSLEWHRQGDTLALQFDCPHEALDLALEQLLAGLEQRRQSLEQVPAMARHPAYKALPRHFDAARLRPTKDSLDRPAYQRPHLRLELDQSRVRELLMGQNLYGKPALALRELYQNALDACRYRRARVQYLRAIGKEVGDYQGRIEFRTGYDEGRPYVECRDNGIGMAERHLRGLFARAGRRFGDSHEYHVEKAAWDEQGIPFHANSRFGIGVFSYFMLADEILVETSRLKRSGKHWEAGLRARIVGSGSLFRLQKMDDEHDDPPQGSVLRLYLNEGAGLETLLDGILEWLWLPEFETVLNPVDGAKTVLAAGQPAPGFVSEAGPGVAVPESLGENGQARFFWSFDKAGVAEYFRKPEYRWHEGVSNSILLADGIRADDDRDCPIDWAVINLTGGLRPELSVDRTRIAAWTQGKQWLADFVKNHAWKHILAAPDADPLLLPSLFLARPWPLLLLDQALRSAPDGSTPCDVEAIGQTVDLSGLGFSFLDIEILTSIIQDPKALVNLSQYWEIFHRRMPIAATSRRKAARLRAWASTSLPMPEAFTLLAGFAGQNDWLDLPLVAALLLGRDRDEIRPARLLQAAAAWAAPLGEVAELARPLARCGVSLPDLDSLPPELQPDRRLAQLLSEELDGQAPWLDDIPLAHLLKAAAEWSMPLGEVVELARPLAQCGVRLPDLDSLPPELQPDRRLAQLLSEDLDGQAPWLDEIPLAQLLQAATAWAVPLGEVIELARPLAQCGLRLPDLDSLPPELQPDRRLAQLLSRNLDGRAPWLGEIPLAQLLKAATAWAVPLGKMAEIARPLDLCGVKLPNLDSLPPELQPDRRLAQLLSKDLDGQAPWLDEITPLQLLKAAAEWAVPLGEVAELARPLELCGLRLPDLGGLPSSLPNPQQLQLWSRDMDRQAPWLDEIAPLQLLKAVAEWGMPLNEAIELAKPLAQWGVKLPKFEDLPVRFMPDTRQLKLLSEELDGESPWLDKITMAHLLKAAVEWSLPIDKVARMAKPLAPFGVQLPAKLPKKLDGRVYVIFERGEAEEPLSAWKLAETATRHHDHPADYVTALEQLAELDLDVAEALAFARFCADRRGQRN